MTEQANHKTVLGADCRITGELALDNDAVIMGQFEGTLRVSGVLELTDSAKVTGTIIAGALRLAGTVEGDVVAEHGTELLAGAQLNGQLYTTKLSVIEGAIFQGDVCVGPKAMQAASAILHQAEQAAIAPAAQQVAQDELHADELAPEQAAQWSQQDILEDQQDESDDTLVAADQAPVRTVPSSLNTILQRRRAAKPMSAISSRAVGSSGRVA